MSSTEFLTGLHERKELYDSVLSAIPTENQMGIAENIQASILWKPTNFDEMREHRRALQTRELFLGRPAELTKRMQEEREKLKSYYQTFGHQMFESVISTLFRYDSIIVDANEFPLETPPGIVQWTAWHKPNITSQQLAERLSDIFYRANVGLNDFILIRNPSYARSSKIHPHLHMLINGEGNNNLKKIIIEDFRKLDGGAELLDTT